MLPVKVLARAKSRLAVLAGARRAELALALASDTVSAVVACPDVARVLVVTSDPGRARGSRRSARSSCPTSRTAGSTPRCATGAAVASRSLAGQRRGRARRRPARAAARPSSAAALRAAAGAAGGAAFVPDAAGVGTTMYAVAPGGGFRPMFGGASRARHASAGAVELSLDGVPGLRRDVDTPEDLRAAVALGAGPHRRGRGRVAGRDVSWRGRGSDVHDRAGQRPGNPLDGLNLRRD